MKQECCVGTVRAITLYYFYVSVVTAVDRAESGLVHCGVGAGQDASPQRCVVWGEKRKWPLLT